MINFIYQIYYCKLIEILLYFIYPEFLIIFRIDYKDNIRYFDVIHIVQFYFIKHL